MGVQLGADLKAIKDRGTEAVLLNILDPNREVKPQYVTYLLLTTQGRTITGLIKSENANSITIARADGTSDTVLRIDIEELISSKLSFMPEGLEKTDQQTGYGGFTGLSERDKIRDEMSGSKSVIEGITHEVFSGNAWSGYSCLLQATQLKRFFIKAILNGTI